MSRNSIKPTLEQPRPGLPDATRLVASQEISEQTGSTTAFRPVLRPPMATVELLDDGLESGEVFRIRKDRTVLGRDGADICVPHDSQVSGAHVAVHRRQVDGDWHWILEDLKSTNGTFLRVARCPFGGQSTVLMGAHRYRYRPPGKTASSESEPEADGTKGWKVPTAEELHGATASLVRLFPDGSEELMPLPEGDVVLGSDPKQCQLVIGDDPMVNPAHAVVKATGGKVVLEDLKSANGIWVTVRERRLPASSTFQIGEQRVRFRVL